MTKSQCVKTTFSFDPNANATSWKICKLVVLVIVLIGNELTFLERWHLAHPFGA